MPLKAILVLAASVAAGGLLGYYGQCTSGACPLTSTWWRGAIYGGVLGAAYLFASGTLSR